MTATGTDALDALDAIDPATLDLAPRRRDAAMRFLLTRRSTPSKLLRAPGPSAPELRLMLRAATRTPDHGKLTPWRLIEVREGARQGLADAAVARAAEAGLPAEDGAKAARQLLEGPTLVVVVSAPVAHAKIPAFEQELSAGAVAAALVNAALAMGYGAQWLTSWIAHDAAFGRAALALRDAERVAGFVHIGSVESAPAERPRPDLDAIVSVLGD